MKKITIKDVAEVAGVSYVTVSNAINNKGRMTEKTKQKVLACIKKMNFHPDGRARSLVSGKSNTIAFMSLYISSPFVTAILAGVEQRLFETEHFAYTLTHNSTKGLHAVKQKLINDMLYGRKADAVIMLTLKPDEMQEKEFKKAGIPLVLIGNRSAGGAHSIVLDNYKGAYMAVDYLLKKGRRKIAIINGPSGITGDSEDENPGLNERFKGYMDALRDNNSVFEPGRVYSVRYFIQEEGIKLLDTILAENPDTDAVFCAAGDMVALGISHRAKQIGVRIPQDISLIGYDDIPVAAVMNPALTTVRQPLDEMGRKAFDLAMGSLDGKIHGAGEIFLSPELIIREST